MSLAFTGLVAGIFLRSTEDHCPFRVEIPRVYGSLPSLRASMLIILHLDTRLNSQMDLCNSRTTVDRTPTGFLIHYHFEFRASIV